MTDNDINKAVRQKVKDIFEALAPDRAKAVSENRIAKNIILRIKKIYSEDYGDRKASTLGMHMSDGWPPFFTCYPAYDQVGRI